MASKEVQPRLSVIMARDAYKAVVIRRGPSSRSRLSLWHTDTDQVEHGQWLHAQIRRSDLSPDGSLFVYCCFHSKAHYSVRQAQRSARGETGYGYSYTVISRPPYFTALTLWNYDSWQDDCLFVDNNKVYIDAPLDTHPDHPLSDRIQQVKDGGLSDEDAFVRRQGLPRGWHLNNPGFIANRPSGIKQAKDRNAFQFYRDSVNGQYRLEGSGAAKDRYRFYRIERFATHSQIAIDGDLTWADWDQRGRLACADKGALYILAPDNPNGERKLIADFNGQTFEGIRAPEWARRW